MNVPFPPVLLVPAPVGVIAAAVWWARARRRRFRTRLRDWQELVRGTDVQDKTPKLSPQPLWWLMIVFGLIWGYWLVRYSVPPLRGIVLDATTGSPVAGATVIRFCSRSGPWSLADSHGPVGVPGSLVQDSTDATGHFTLPGVVTRSLTGVTWVVFKPGLMPGNGCYTTRSMKPGGCSFGVGWHPDPWVKATLHGNLLRVRVEVCVFPPSANGAPREGHDSRGTFLPAKPPDLNSNGTPFVVDAWGEYFRRVNILVRDRLVPLRDFAKTALDYLKKHPITEGMIDPLAELAGRLPYGPEYDVVAKAVLEYCRATPASETCGHVGPGYLALQHSRRHAQE